MWNQKQEEQPGIKFQLKTLLPREVLGLAQGHSQLVSSNGGGSCVWDSSF